MKDDSVIVFIDGSNLHLTPKSVQDSYASDAAKSGLPIMVIYDHAIEKELGVLGYKAIRSRDGFKNVKVELKKLSGEAPEAVKKTSS